MNCVFSYFTQSNCVYCVTLMSLISTSCILHDPHAGCAVRKVFLSRKCTQRINIGIVSTLNYDEKLYPEQGSRRQQTSLPVRNSR